jgi:hypothetical protein
MNRIRTALRKLPPSAVIKLLRKVFSLPAPAARLILNDITRARKEHKPWIHKIPKNDDWSGCWIGENVSKLDPEGLTQRINEADIVFFYVHGKYPWHSSHVANILFFFCFFVFVFLL